MHHPSPPPLAVFSPPSAPECHHQIIVRLGRPGVKEQGEPVLLSKRKQRLEVFELSLAGGVVQPIVVCLIRRSNQREVQSEAAGEAKLD
jgi:replicative superfamily II helicase